MWDLRRDMLENPDDPLTTFTEYAAPKGCDLDDEEAWAAANPALGSFLFADALRAGLPPKTREATFRRARLGQWTEAADDAWMEPGAWSKRSTGQADPGRRGGVLALDGSHSPGHHCAGRGDASSETPHIDVVGYWANPGDPDWRVDVLDVEDSRRSRPARRWRVREITADPFLWQRTLQVLARKGLPVTEFPQTIGRG